MRATRFIPPCALALLGPGVRAEPQIVAVANPSFEAFYVQPGGYRTGDIGGWQREGGKRESIGIQSISAAVFPLHPGPGGEVPHVLAAPAEGPQFAFLNPAGDGASIALFQVVGPLKPRTRYTLTVALGNRLDKGYADRVLLELRNGDAVTSPLLAALANTRLPADGAFADHSVSFETGDLASGNLVIVIRNQGGSQIVVDNVRLVADAAAR